MAKCKLIGLVCHEFQISYVTPQKYACEASLRTWLAISMLYDFDIKVIFLIIRPLL